MGLTGNNPQLQKQESTQGCKEQHHLDRSTTQRTRDCILCENVRPCEESAPDFVSCHLMRRGNHVSTCILEVISLFGGVRYRSKIHCISEVTADVVFAPRETRARRLEALHQVVGMVAVTTSQTWLPVTCPWFCVNACIMYHGGNTVTRIQNAAQLKRHQSPRLRLACDFWRLGDPRLFCPPSTSGLALPPSPPPLSLFEKIPSGF